MADSKRTSTVVVITLSAIVVLIAGLLWWCGRSGGGSTTRAGRTATIIAVNDIYRIDGVGASHDGGLHRLRTLRKEEEKKNGKVLLLHAGDFLSPSLESRVFKGEQMIDAMNNLDGDSKKFDSRMFVAFGNHEFDDSDCNKSPAPLVARLNESQFTWLNTNLDFSNCPSMKDVPAHKNVKRTAIVELNGIRLGIFGIGLTPDIKDAKKYPKFGDPYETARAAIKELRGKKVDAVIALTHLNRGDDEVLVRSLAEIEDKPGLDLLIGGHDHTRMEIADSANVKRGFKSDSDATTARLVKIEKPSKAGERVSINGTDLRDLKEENVANDETVVRDPAMSKITQKWWKETQAKLCAERKKAGRPPDNPDCLQMEAGSAQFPINLQEVNNRNTETNFGRWLAETVRTGMDADVAIINSGSLGLNTNLPKGAKLYYRDVLDIFRFDDIVAVREVPAKTVCAAVRHGFAKPSTGAWPHVAGISPTDGPTPAPDENPALPPDDAKKIAQDIRAKWNEKITFPDKSGLVCDVKNDPDEKITVRVASVPYLMCGGDDYPPLVPKDEQGPNCVDTLRRNPKDPKVPEGRLMSVIAEDEIVGKKDKGGIVAPGE